MAQANDTLGIIHQNLIDAGCDDETTARCMQLVKEDRSADMLSLLARYRTALLGAVRAGQKQLDRLDYLVYQIQRQNY